LPILKVSKERPLADLRNPNPAKHHDFELPHLLRVAHEWQVAGGDRGEAAQ
jgi:hypothetical protein